VNYRHAFHAGNFADVFKHAVLCRILHYLRAKPAAFRVIDSQAGAGLYDLAGPEASRGADQAKCSRGPACLRRQIGEAFEDEGDREAILDAHG